MSATGDSALEKQNRRPAESSHSGISASLGHPKERCHDCRAGRDQQRFGQYACQRREHLRAEPLAQAALVIEETAPPRPRETAISTCMKVAACCCLE